MSVEVGIASRESLGLRRAIWRRNASCLENGGTHGVATPEHICLRAVLFGEKAVQKPGALRFLGVRHKKDFNTCFLFEALGNRASENVIDRGVNDYLRRMR